MHQKESPSIISNAMVALHVPPSPPVLAANNASATTLNMSTELSAQGIEVQLALHNFSMSNLVVITAAGDIDASTDASVDASISAESGEIPVLTLQLGSHALRNPDKARIEPTHNYKKPKTDKLTKQLKQQVRKEKEAALILEIKEEEARREEWIQGMAKRHNRSPEYIREQINYETHYRQSREINLHNAKVHWKVEELNRNLPCGQRARMDEILEAVAATIDHFNFEIVALNERTGGCDEIIEEMKVDTLGTVQAECAKIILLRLRNSEEKVGKSTIQMAYSRYDVEIRLAHCVELQGWPTGVPFTSPSSISSKGHIMLLHDALRDGDCVWASMSTQAVADLKKHLQENGTLTKKHATRKDKGGTHAKQQQSKQKATDENQDPSEGIPPPQKKHRAQGLKAQLLPLQMTQPTVSDGSESDDTDCGA
ncbi:hypothetical protein NP233_g8540 [Leucocoprinus birnbaumii]|uniref:Uncharacterized protein n=1 Tax=Leucocoprinus birnbaumii TaxID=56174 RepID=A0AAD5VNU4_9AGAR|nr:hypothetical protein NP233_g8540 [Leucocoprinus birnbaumii]